MTTVVLLLVAAVLVYTGLGLLQRTRRSRIGLTGSTIIAADDSRIGLPTLHSERLGLVGRPDQLVRIDGRVIPVEQKPRATRMHDSHVMQLAAECLDLMAYWSSRTGNSTAWPLPPSSSSGYFKRSLE